MNFAKCFNSKFCLLVLGPLWISLDFVVLGKFSYLPTGDNAEITLPALMAYFNTGVEPGNWHIFSTSGTDKLSIGFFGIIQELMFRLLPGWVANQLLVLSQILAAFFGVYLLSRSLRIDKIAGIFSAFLYGLLYGRGILVESVQPYLPLLIYLISCVIREPRKLEGWVYLVFASLIFSTTSYISMLMPFTALIVFAWFLIVDSCRRVFDWSVIAVVMAIIILPRFPDYISIAQYGLLSARHSVLQDYDNLSTMLDAVRSIYIGSWVASVITVLACYGTCRYLILDWKQARLGIALASGTVFLLLIVAVKPLLVDQVDLLRTFNLNRFQSYFNFLLFLAAGQGLARLWTDVGEMGLKGTNVGIIVSRRSLVVVSVVFVGVVSIQQKVLHAQDWISQGSYVNQFESPVYREYADKLKRDDPYRVTSFQMYPNFPNAYGIETVSGYQALNIKRFQDFWNIVLEKGKNEFPPASRSEFFRLGLLPLDHRAKWPINQVYNLNLLSLANVKYIFSRDELVAPELRQIRKPFKPWSLLSTSQKLRTNFSDNFNGKRHLYVYENLNVLPRYFLVDKVQIFNNGDEVLAALADAEIDELRSTAFMESKDISKRDSDGLERGDGKIDLESYKPDELIFSVSLKRKTLLIVTNTYSPYWQVDVDNGEANLIPANHAFWGVLLSPETRTVRFRYEPPYRITNRD